MAINADVGTPEANSYVTVEEAEAYFGNRFHSDAWDALETETPKEALLVTATNLLDWHIRFKGVKSYENQSLEWPRTNATRRDGTVVGPDLIPVDVKQAVFELALFSVEEDRVSENDLAGLGQVKAGPLMIKSDGGGYESTAKQAIPNHVKKIVEDLTLNGTISTVRLMRA